MLAATAGAPAMAQTHREMQERFCAGMELEHRLGDRTRIDCLSATHAIELDWTGDWAQAVGQALVYGSQTGRRAGIILVCRQREDLCYRHALRLEAVLAAYRFPVTVWLCSPGDGGLGACSRAERP